MAIRSIEMAKDEINDVIMSLKDISFDPPVIEPRDDASADEWKDFAMELIGLIDDIESGVKKATSALED